MRKPNFFSRGSPYLAHPMLTPQRTKDEIDFLLSKISLPAGGSVLDIGCGFGRHSIELARRGYSVLGIDPSSAMIEAALQASTGLPNPPKFVQAPAEEYETDQRFDAAICLFTTLGQIDDKQDNHKLVMRASSLLQPGAYFIVEVPQFEWVQNNLKTNERFQTPESMTFIERSFESSQRIVTEIFTIVTTDQRQVYLLRYRIFDAVELAQLVENSGLQVIDMYGGYQDAPIEESSQALVMIAGKT